MIVLRLMMRISLLALILMPVLHASKDKGLEPREPLPDFIGIMAGIESTTLHEGLPHRLFEETTFKKEREKNGVFSIGGEYFYPEVLPISREDEYQITHLLGLPETVKPYSGYKLCGGFHADYMITWRKREDPPISVLFCFGCGEVLIVNGDLTQRADLTPDGHRELATVLKKYRLNRPVFSDPRTNKFVPPSPSVPKVEVKLNTASDERQR